MSPNTKDISSGFFVYCFLLDRFRQDKFPISTANLLSHCFVNIYRLVICPIQAQPACAIHHMHTAQMLEKTDGSDESFDGFAR